MADYNNPTGVVTVGTAGDDTFTITDRGATLTRVVNGSGGYDRLIVDRSFDTGSSIIINQFSGNPYVQGTINPGSYYDNGTLYFQEFENIKYTGTAGGDGASIKLDQAGLVVALDLDAGAGLDKLTLDLSAITSALTFNAETSIITSSFGTFKGFEVFVVYGGAGNDEIRTGDGNDDLRGGAGTNILSAGGGADFIYSTSITDWTDGGAGNDNWQANYANVTNALTVDIGGDVKVNGATVAINVELISVGTGSGDDVVNLKIDDQGVIDGGVGNDLLNFRPSTDQVETVLLNGGTDGTWAQASINATALYRFERVDIMGGALGDSFRVLGAFTSGQLTLDGGGGSDYLIGQFDYFNTATTFAVQPDGTISSNRGQFSSFERFNIIGGSGNDMIVTGAGNDNLSGGDGNDVLDGGGGDDVILGGAGRDELHGGAGSDLLYISFAADYAAGETYDGGADEDTLVVGGNVDLSISTVNAIETITINGSGAVSMTGSQLQSFSHITTQIYFGPETITLTTGGPINYSGSADIVTFNFAAVDTQFDLSGVTSVVQATVNGGDGNDVITGSMFADVLNGGTGDDRLTNLGADDTLAGGAGNDTYLVTDSSTVILEGVGRGNDTIKTTVSYVLAAGVEVETVRLANGSAGLDLTGNAFSGKIIGNGNDNILDGGGGGDTLRGGLGNDTYIVRDAADAVVEATGEGDDTVKAAMSYTLGAGAEVEHLWTLDAAATTAINLTGNEYSHDLQGNAGVNVLTGGSGDDFLSGNGGADTLIGGAGNDTYLINDATAVIVESVGGGNDRIKTTVSYVLAAGAEVETIQLAFGSAGTNLTGNAYASKIIGNSNDNVLDGGGGGDALRGGLGNDTYIVRDASDRIVEASGEGNDIVQAAVSYTLTTDAFVETLRTIDASATTAINLTGNDHTLVIQGNAGANVLTGGAGNETISGFGGNDTLFGGGGNDVFAFASGTGQDSVGDFVSGSDKLDLSAFFSSFAQVQAATHDVGGNAVIDLGGGNNVTLSGFLTAQLQSGDVILSSGAAQPADGGAHNAVVPRELIDLHDLVAHQPSIADLWFVEPATFPMM